LLLVQDLLLRQSFVRRRQNCGAYADCCELRAGDPAEETIGPAPGDWPSPTPPFGRAGSDDNAGATRAQEGRRFISQDAMYPVGRRLFPFGTGAHRDEAR
jgi:hypothetical protein